ncbi:MAG: hypothetical protein P8M80_11360 [Pirellulaceae bacterium]|nr:hypothetical protein [Pirellulaceae bacterium]
MKRSFAVGTATFAIMIAIALSFGASSAEAQLLRRSCCGDAPKSCCGSTPKLMTLLRANKCCAEEAAPEAEEATADACCSRPGLLAKLKSMLPKRGCGCRAATGCSGCEAPAATDSEADAIPPAPEKAAA